MSISILQADEVRRALSIRDLTDPSAGPHALQLLIDAACRTLREAWSCELRTSRKSPIVSLRDNYDRLRYSADAAARDARYTRYVCDVAVLRTQTSALIPAVLDELASAVWSDLLIACPGITYRRDCIDRLHTGEPHQLDLWRLRRATLATSDLEQMVALVVRVLLPGYEYRTSRAEHPYTMHGLQIDVRNERSWVEIGECGLVHPELLRATNHDPTLTSGLAMGLGLDRILMLRKGIDDIRLLRSSDSRVAQQMLDLERYRPVSVMPPVRRDLSVAVDETLGAEELGDLVRAALESDASAIESVELIAETPYAELPTVAIERLGIAKGQKNVLVRVVLRALDRTLTHAECNVLRDRIYGILHHGTRHEWAARKAR